MASKEQFATREEINRSVNQVNTLAADTASAMQDAARSVLDLKNQAQILTDLIKKMKPI